MDRLERAAQLRKRIDSDPTDAEAHFALARVLRELEDDAAAARYAARAADLRPDYGEAETLAALCYHLAGDIETAWPHYERALILCPPDAVLLYNAGVAADALAKAEEAIRLYEKALRLRPDYPEALNNLGIALATGRHYEEAARVYCTLLEMRATPDRHLAHCNLGLVYHYLGRIDEAIQSYEAAIALEPTFSVAYCNLGNAYYAKGWATQATEMYQAAIAQNPDNVQAYNALGGLGEAPAEGGERVVEEYQHYLDRHPWSALVYYNLGVTLAAKGNAEEAIAQLDKALFLEPRFREAQQARAALERQSQASAD